MPAAIPARPTTGTLLAVGASTAGVDDAERKLAPYLLASTPEARRLVRDALLHLAQHFYESGQERRQAVLMEHSLAVRDAYWRAASLAEKARNNPDARPAIVGVLEVLRAEGTPLPERDVRSILRLFGLVTAD